ncbi:MAG: elongation factor Ts [Patescibacteria group bacterium]
MSISMELILKLREKTGAGIMDVKKALEEAGNDEVKALELLYEKGQKIAAKKQAEREAKEGIVEAYTHGNKKMATLVQLACETDFVAKNQEFQELAHDIAMQVAATNPQYLSSEKVPSEVLKDILESELKSFYEENCLLSQKFIKDNNITIHDLITEKIAKLGEKIEIKKIARISF